MISTNTQRTVRRAMDAAWGRGLGLGLVALSAAACDGVADPLDRADEAAPHEVSIAALQPGEPRLATAAEAAMLARIGAGETPPEPSALGNRTAASASAAASQCTIGFADYIGLLILPQQAGHTFASAPFYIEGCGSGWVHVKENDVARYGPLFGSSYDHYHLMYEKGPYCIPGGGGSYGYHNGSSCVNVPTPANEPRYLSSHTGSEWIRIYVYRSGVPEMTWDLRGITVKPSQPIKLWFRKANGSWYYWSSLGVGSWNTSAYSYGIKEVLIRAANNSSNPYSFDDIDVTVN